MNINVKVAVAAMFNAQLNTLLRSCLQPYTNSGIVAVSDSFEAVLDQNGATPLDRPQGWQNTTNAIVAKTLFQTSIDDLKVSAPCYFAAFGSEEMCAVATKEVLKLAAAEEADTTFQVLVFGFGIMVLSTNPAMEMVALAKMNGSDLVSQDCADAVMSVIIDASLSMHERLEALKFIDDFIATMIAQTVNDRGDDAKDFFEDIHFKALL